jgi:hypothetical protein
MKCVGLRVGVKSNPTTLTLTHYMIYTSVYVTYMGVAKILVQLVENKSGIVFLEDNVNWVQMVSIA